MVEDIAGAFTANQTHFRGFCTFCAGHQKAKELAGESLTLLWPHPLIYPHREIRGCKTTGLPGGP